VRVEALKGGLRKIQRPEEEEEEEEEEECLFRRRTRRGVYSKLTQ